MKNEIYFKEMKTQLSYGLRGSFVTKLQEDLDLFYEQNKDLPEDDFYFLCNKKYLPLFEAYNKKADYLILKKINGVLQFFKVLVVISLVLSIIYAIFSFLN